MAGSSTQPPGPENIPLSVMQGAAALLAGQQGKQIADDLQAWKNSRTTMTIGGRTVEAVRLDAIRPAIERLERVVLEAAERSDLKTLELFAGHQFPLTHAHPKTRETPLHILAGNGARKVLRKLFKTAKFNYLARDRQGRLASELAFRHGDDPALSRLLAMKERKQAAERGVTLTYRPQR